MTMDDAIKKELPGDGLYPDVVEAGLILPRKEKYTLIDVKKLMKFGWSALDALWIVRCSCCFHRTRMSNKISTESFLIACEYDLV